jgi:hypothetical protein
MELGIGNIVQQRSQFYNQHVTFFRFCYVFGVGPHPVYVPPVVPAFGVFECLLGEGDSFLDDLGVFHKLLITRKNKGLSGIAIDCG